MKTFEELGVSEPLLKAVEELGFENPMPIQERVIPRLLGDAHDIIALAQTGTGKTAAFGLPVLQRIDPKINRPQALILAPTRELCLQIGSDLADFSKYIPSVKVLPVYGGSSIESQIRMLKKGVQIIVATPGRLIDLIKRGVVKLDDVHTVVLDEADEMLNMGFLDSLEEILSYVPEERKMLLFSATMPADILKIAKRYMKDYEEIVVGTRNEGAENVRHIYYMVNARDKYLALKRIVDFYPRIYAIIFCRTKVETQDVADKLIRDGYNAESLHGDLSQAQRDQTMQKFRQHTIQLLVATDVAARGLDVDDLTHVINYGLPDDIESYTHRSGRTGRAGKKGTSISIIHTRERHKVRLIEKEIGKEFVDGTLPTPEEICQKQLYKTMDDIMKTDVDEEQIAPYMPEITRQFEYIDKEDIIKKMVTITFGRFLEYYKNAPEIVKPTTGRKEKRGEKSGTRGERGSRRGERGGRREGGSFRGGHREAEQGFRRLFINLGKQDGFYPGEVMQFINRHVRGHQEVGHIDLLPRFSYIEVPEDDAQRVMRALDGQVYKGRPVRCNDADGGDSFRQEGAPRRGGYGSRRDEGGPRRRDGGSWRDRKDRRPFGQAAPARRGSDDGDWRSLIKDEPFKLKGEEPDFSEEGWARRKPRKG